MNQALASQLRPYLQNLLAQNMDTQGFENTDSLFLSGRIDSFSLMQLVMYLEERFHIDFSSLHFEAALLDSVIDIVAFVEEHGERSSLLG